MVPSELAPGTDSHTVDTDSVPSGNTGTVDCGSGRVEIKEEAPSQTFQILKLPKELILGVFNQLRIRDRRSFSQTNKFLHQLLSPVSARPFHRITLRPYSRNCNSTFDLLWHAFEDAGMQLDKVEDLQSNPIDRLHITIQSIAWKSSFSSPAQQNRKHRIFEAGRLLRPDHCDGHPPSTSKRDRPKLLRALRNLRELRIEVVLCGVARAADKSDSSEISRSGPLSDTLNDLLQIIAPEAALGQISEDLEGPARKTLRLEVALRTSKYNGLRLISGDPFLKTHAFGLGDLWKVAGVLFRPQNFYDHPESRGSGPPHPPRVDLSNQTEPLPGYESNSKCWANSGALSSSKLLQVQTRSVLIINRFPLKDTDSAAVSTRKKNCDSVSRH